MAYVKGKGTTLSVGGTTIGQIVSISGPSASVRTKETTHLGSTRAEFIATISESGELSFQIELDTALASHEALRDLWDTDNPAAASWVLTFSNSDTFAFSGILTSYDVSGMEVDEVLMADCTVQITGDIVFTS